MRPRRGSPLARRNEIMRNVLWTDPPLDAQGAPLLLIGGLGSTTALLAPLRDLLRRFGFQCEIAPTGRGLDCGGTIAAGVELELERLADRAGRPAFVVGHSRGGQCGRAVVARRPELAAGLVTLGSPLVRLLDVHPLLLLEIGVLGLAGAAGVPGLLRISCAWAACCANLRAALSGAFPAHVPFTSIYSRADHVVNWRGCLDPAARHREVRASHSGLTWSGDSLHALAEELRVMLVPACVTGARRVG